MDDKPKILFISTFDRNNLYPYVAHEEKEVDRKMVSLIGTEKKIGVNVKKINDKLYFNVISIFNN